MEANFSASAHGIIPFCALRVAKGLNIIMSDISTTKEKLFWSPSVCWLKNGDKLKIEIFEYNKAFADLFPEFYYLTQNGIEKTELIHSFKNIEPRKIDVFISDLYKKRILVDSILEPSEIFYPQKMLLEHDYGDDLLFNKEKLDIFTNKQLSRNCYPDAHDIIELKSDRELPDCIKYRRTIREFDTQKALPFFDFSYLASTYRQTLENGRKCYNYASAGGLYPVDVYYYIKAGRVQKVEQGLYYYDPVKDGLIPVNTDVEFPAKAHFFTNRDIFSQSAFSIYYFYNGDVSIPKYGGKGYFYSIIDLGIMVSTLTSVAEGMGIGVCSIGDMDFGVVRRYFKLNKNQIYLHTVEAGIKRAM